MEALGLVAIILSVIGVFTPFAGIFISGLSGLIAISACRKRNSYALAAVILNVINLIIFSPQMLLMALSPSRGGFLDNSEFKYVFWAIFVIQLIGVFLYIKNKPKSVVSNT
jgi:hypothetical protein